MLTVFKKLKLKQLFRNKDKIKTITYSRPLDYFLSDRYLKLKIQKKKLSPRYENSKSTVLSRERER